MSRDPSSTSSTGVEVSRELSASPDTVWSLVSDVTRMGEWSPETTAGEWVGEPRQAVEGARFRGRNQIGWRRWSTTCTVIAAEPGRRFAFRVASVGLPVAEWSFEIEPREGGSRVTERCVDLRGRTMRALGRLATGVADRETHNRAGMTATLEGLDRVAHQA